MKIKKKDTKQLGLTVSSIEKPFVHLIRFPEAIDVCITGNEKVKPSSLCLPGGSWKSGPSWSTNFASSAAIKSNSAWNYIKSLWLLTFIFAYKAWISGDNS